MKCLLLCSWLTLFIGGSTLYRFVADLHDVFFGVSVDGVFCVGLVLHRGIVLCASNHLEESVGQTA